jgi:uncharacterized protein (TIGR02598 family)
MLNLRAHPVSSHCISAPGPNLGSLARSWAKPRQKQASHGFSLMEVVTAVAVTSFGCVSLLGLLPAGLDTFGAAMETSVRGQIVQRLVNDAKQTDFTVLNTANLRHFDGEGNEFVGAPSVSPPAGTVFTAQMISLGNATLPAAPAASQSLLTVRVQIAKNPGRVSNPFAATSKIPVTTHCAYVSKNR